MSQQPTRSARPTGKRRPESDREAALRKFFAEQEVKSIDNLEAAARQIIQLVTALLGLLFGVLALSDGDAVAALKTPLVFWPGLLALGLTLIGLVCALAVIWPGLSTPRAHVPADEERAFAALLARKRDWLYRAVVAFGGGMLAFAVTVMVMMWLRYRS